MTNNLFKQHRGNCKYNNRYVCFPPNLGIDIVHLLLFFWHFTCENTCPIVLNVLYMRPNCCVRIILACTNKKVFVVKALLQCVWFGCLHRAAAMWIQVRTMDGKETHRVDNLSKLTKVDELRLKIMELFKVEPEKQRLFYRGKQVRFCGWNSTLYVRKHWYRAKLWEFFF